MAASPAPFTIYEDPEENQEILDQLFAQTTVAESLKDPPTKLFPRANTRNTGLFANQTSHIDPTPNAQRAIDTYSRFSKMATSGSTANQPRTRPKERAAGDEEATGQLKLGEFEDVPTLSNSEVMTLLGAVKEQRSNRGRPLPENEIINKTEDYLQVFSRFKKRENINAVEKILDQTGLDRFEKSQLGNLCCETYEEAKALIPSLHQKISDNDLQEILDDITKMRNFTE